jgi:eukaryotic-like serine/threonine-protein kinase
MEFCPGGSLADRARERPLTPREAARLVQQTASGVAAAHAAGLVHRDLKPQNVLLTDDGTPKVSDFGLAKRLDESAEGLTRTGDILGTPSFMAPEQAFGNAKGVGREADVYALGAVLYDLLCGRPPFIGPSPVETLIRVVSEDPEQPRRLRAEIPRDLEAICLKCLEKDPRKRYPTAAELAQDLACFLAGEPVSSIRSGLLAQMAGALERVPLHEQFAAYGTLLFLLVPVMVVPEVLVTLVVWNDLPVGWLPAIQFSRVAAFVLAIGSARSWSWAPRGPVERLLYLVWGGYLVCCFVTGLSYRIVNGLALTRIELNLYQSFATLTALAFFSLSGTFWGHCLIIGLAFLGLAFVMAIDPAYAALEFGGMWAVVLGLLGWRLRSLARASQP